MPDNDLPSGLWEKLWARISHELANLGVGTEGERRQDTQRNNWWVDDRRRSWDTPDEQADRAHLRRHRVEYESEAARLDREWLRRTREAAGKKTEGARQIFIGVASALLGAAILYLVAHVK